MYRPYSTGWDLFFSALGALLFCVLTLLAGRSQNWRFFYRFGFWVTLLMTMTGVYKTLSSGVSPSDIFYLLMPIQISKTALLEDPALFYTRLGISLLGLTVLLSPLYFMRRWRREEEQPCGESMGM